MDEEIRDRHPVQSFLANLLLMAVYVTAAKLSLKLASIHPSATPVWPPTGIALAALVLYGRHLWPAIFVGAFVANVTTSGAPLSSLAIAVGNSLEALLGSFLVHRFAQGKDAFDRPENIFRWTLFAAIGASVLSATVGVAALVLEGSAPLSKVVVIWITWWLGDAGGALIVAPLLVLWGRRRRALPLARYLEAAVVAILLLGLSMLAFGVPNPLAPEKTYPIPYTLPILAWAAFRLGPRATATTVVALSALAIWGTVEGQGIFAHRSLNESLILLQVYLSISAVTALALAAAVEERVRAEEALSLLAAIVKSSGDAVISKTAKGTVTSWNEGAERLFQFQAWEIVGQPITRIIPDELQEEEAGMLPQLLQGERIEHFLTTRRRKDGRRLTVSLTSSLLRDREGRVLGMSTIARDVSDQQFLTQASKTLAASLDYEETLREVAHLAAEHMADWCSVHVVEESGAIRHLATHHRDPQKARWAAEMTGDYPVRAQSERGIPRVLRTGAPELYPDITPELLREAATDERHLELLLAAGLRSAMIVPLKVGSRILGTLTFLTAESRRRYLPEDLPLAEALADRAARAIENAKLYRLAQKEVEERKSAERQVLELNAHLEERVRERTRELQEALLELEAFSYSIAHDLRAPLRSMTGFSEMLAEEYSGKLDEVGQDYTRRISESARRMDALIQDLLSYSRLAREEVLIEPVDVGLLLEELVDSMAVELRERKAKVELRGPFPTVLGYRTTLLQALTNLLSNAVKFVAPGVEPRVILRSEERSGWGRLWIEDNGLGIDMKYHQTIFGVFQRLHSGEAYPGTGIGLAIVRKAMERMGGKVGLESEVGRGSRFFIELPLVGPGEFGRPPVLRSPRVGRS